MTKVKLSTNERMILKMIEQSSIHKPVSIKELMALCKTTSRQIKSYISDLRNHYSIPIMAMRTGNKFGYFIPKDEKERQIGIKPYDSQIKSEIQTLMIIKQANLKAYKKLLKETV